MMAILKTNFFTGKISASNNKPNRFMALALRSGVIISAATITLGAVLFLLSGQSGYAANNDFLAYHAQDSGQAVYFPVNPLEIWQGVIAGKPFAIIMLGILFLIVTPIINLIIAGWGFIQQKNKFFIAITLSILAILIFSFLLGKNI